MKIKAEDKYRLAGLIFILFYLVLFFAIYFVAAGTYKHLFAWISLGSYSLISIINVFMVDPELILERLRFGSRNVNQKDRILASVSFLFFAPVTLLIAGLDRGRFIWTQSIPLTIQIIGVGLYVFGNLFSRWAMVNNRYFSTFVRIQEDRGHVVKPVGLTN